MTDPPATAFKSRRKQGQGVNATSLWPAPNLSDGVGIGCGAARVPAGAEGLVDETQKDAFQPESGIRSWDEVVQRWCGLKWASPDEDFDALAGASWQPTTRDTLAAHLREIARLQREERYRSPNTLVMAYVQSPYGGERRTRRCGESLAQSARWRIWNGSNPSSIEKSGVWPSTRYPATRKTTGPLGVWIPCNLSRRGAQAESSKPSMDLPSSPSSGSCGSVRQYQYAGASKMRPCVSEGSRIAGACSRGTSAPLRPHGQTGLKNMHALVRKVQSSYAPKEWPG